MRRTSVLLAVYTGILTVGLLAPLDLYTGNGAQWARGADAVVFDSPGILRARRTPHRLYEDLMSGSGFAAAVRVMSHSVEQGGPARIVSYSADTGARNFTIAQDGSALVGSLQSRAFRGGPGPLTRERRRGQRIVPRRVATASWHSTASPSVLAGSSPTRFRPVCHS